MVSWRSGQWPVPGQQKGLTLNEDQAFFIGLAAQSALASRAARVGLRACAPAAQHGQMAMQAAGRLAARLTGP